MILYLQTEIVHYMKNFIKFCLLSSFLLSNFALFAQPGTGGDGGLEGGDPAPAPINDKLIYLIIIGLFFAFYKLKRNYKKI
jgi:hypothetical protein